MAMIKLEEREMRFDRALYLRNNPDVAAVAGDPWQHWLNYGRHEERRGLRANWRAPKFDGDYYVALYPDVAPLIENGQFTSAADHWFLVGRDEVADGRRAVPQDFDEAAYRARRPDIAEAIAAGAFISGFDHWLEYGRSEEGLTRPRGADPTRRPALVDDARARFWHDQGYLILEGMIAPERCDAITARIEQLWQDRSTAPPVSIDINLETPEQAHVKMAEAPGEARGRPYKINDMLMYDTAVRSVALDPQVCSVIAWVLDSAPVAIGSLNFERGSSQTFHTDTLYMPGISAGGMTAAWYALEDVSPDAGPLLYYPGSHNIPLFRFSSGRSLQIDAEFPDYVAHQERHVRELALVPAEFLPRKGDVLIWHEKLYHGGAPIRDLGLTRRSLVVHYWREDEMRDRPLVRAEGGFYWDRPPL